MAYLLAVLGGIVVVVGYLLAWLGVPSAADGAQNQGTSAFDILLASKGSLSAIGNGGVGDGSIGLDVRFVLFVALVAALAGAISALVKPMFGALLPAGLIALVGPIYFLVQLVLRNSQQFNTPALAGLLRWGFYITLLGSLLIVATSFRYRRVPTMQSRADIHGS